MAITFNHNDQVYVKDGKMGIGTASPQTTLHLSTTGSSTLTIQNTTNSGNATLNFRDESSADQYSIYYALGANRAYNLVNGNGLTIYSSQVSGEIARFGTSTGYTDSYFTGNVGIGTTSPDHKLTVYTDATSGLELVGQDGGNQNSDSSKIIFNGYAQDNGPFIQAVTTSAYGIKRLGFFVNRTASDYTTLPTESISITNTGNVGIGKTDPSAPLHINGGSTNQVVKIQSNSAPYIRFKEGGTDVGFIQFGTDTYISNQKAGTLNFRTNNTDKMTILSGGNVGIGTTSPDEKLSVVGNTGLYGTVSGGIVSPASLRFFTSEDGAGLGDSTDSNKQKIGQITWAGKDTSSNATGEYAAIRTYLIDSNNLIQGSANEGGQIEFSILRHDVGGSSRVERTAMTINNSANVGIGTTSPNAKLDVNGVIRSRGGNYSADTDTKTNAGIVIAENDFIYTEDGTDYLRKLIGKSSDIISIGESGTSLIDGINLMPGTTGGYVQVFNDGSIAAKFVDGKLGLGTTDPSSDLDVVGNTRLGPDSEHAFQVTDDSTNNFLVLSSTQRTTASAARDIKFRSYGTDATDNVLVMDMSAGNVGIGTASPGAELEISKAGSPVFMLTNTSAAQSWTQYVGSNDDFILRDSTDSRTVFRVSGGGDTYFEGGNVGIGTDSPTNKLDVRGLTRLNALSLRGGTDNYAHLSRFSWRDTNSSSTGTTWKKVCGVSLGSGNYSALSMEVVHYYPGSNHGNSASLSKHYYSISFRRSSGTQDNQDNAVVYGRDANFIRVVRTALGEFELQARANGSHLSYSVDITQTGGNSDAITMVENSSTNGNTTGTIYAAVSSANTVVSLPGSLGAGSNVYLNHSGHSYLNGGNVGIGTTAPDAPLTVHSSTDPEIRFGYSSTQDHRIQWDSSKVFIHADPENANASSAIALYVDGGAKLYIPDSGNVGIGSTAPAAKLNVASTGANAYSSTITKGTNMKGIINALSNNADDMVGIYFGTGTTSEGTHWSGITGSRSQSATDWSTQLNFYTHNEDVANINDATQKMVIKGNGNVGIGTTSPGSRLDLGLSSAGGMQFLYDSSQAYRHQILNYWNSSTDSRMDFNIGRTANVAPVTVMSVGYAGNVGIGTTSPDYPLTVYNASGAVLKLDSGGANNSQVRFHESGTLKAAVTYIPANDQIRVYNEGDILTIGTNNVGIGTTNPSAKLDVTGPTSTTEPTLNITSGTSQVYGNIAMYDSYHGLIMRGIPAASNTYGVSAGDQMSFYEYGGQFRFYKKQPSVLTEIARIDSSNSFFNSNVGIGTTNPGYKLTVDNDALNTNNPALYVKNPNSSTAAVIAEFVGDSDSIQIKNIGTGDYVIYNSQQSNGIALFDGTGGVEIRYNGSTVLEADSTGGVKVTGQLSATGDVVAYSSDERLKENIKPIESAVDKIKQLKGVTFDWNEKSEELGFEPSTKTNDVGVIAQDVEAVFPQLVQLAPFDIGSDEDGNATSKSGEDYKTVNYARLTAVLIEAVKEQQQQIDELKAKLDGITK